MNYIPCEELTVTCDSCGRLYTVQWQIDQPKPETRIKDCVVCKPVESDLGDDTITRVR